MRKHEVQKMICITEGAFRVYRRSYKTLGGYSAIEHKCGDNLWGVNRWYDFVFSIEARGRQCHACHLTPPDGIQAVFWMLK